MPNREKKMYDFIFKYLNLKKPSIKDFTSNFDPKSVQKVAVLQDYLSLILENAKSKVGIGTTSLLNSAYRIDLSKFIGDLKVNVSPKKQPKIPKWKINRPTITMEGINLRTKHLLSMVKQAELHSSRLKRLEELLAHVIQYPEAKIFAVKAGGIGLLLKVRTNIADNASKETIRMLLAALGYADPPKSSGIRILAIDGGGMRGLAVLQMLQMIENISGHKIYHLFDFICGVSTGAIITCGLVPPNKLPMNRIYDLYLDLSSKVFNQSAIWGTSKLVWSHAYYDTSLWEKFLMDYVGDLNLIETNKSKSCPKIAVVSTIVNHSKVAPFIFRNYGNPCYKASDYTGSFRHTMFEAVRASAAAPTIFEEFKTGHMLHQDGGIVVNNPAAIALHEARSLWPDENINCVVSIGTGKYDPLKNEDDLAESSKYSSSWKQIFDRILESATDTEAVHRILNDLLPDDTYFRLNPHLSRFVTMDETNSDKLNALQEDTQMYCRRNEDKFHEIARKLTQHRPLPKKIKDSIILQIRSSGLIL